jgi:plasmid rolling circle replication initiator protein Rep
MYYILFSGLKVVFHKKPSYLDTIETTDAVKNGLHPLPLLGLEVVRRVEKILKDVSASGKERPWAKRKGQALLVADSFKRLGYGYRYVRITQCGEELRFRVCLNDGYKKLYHANFCRDRLCPMCNWRRSLKIGGNVYKIVSSLEKFSFIHLVVTQKNVVPDQLKVEVDKLYHAWSKMRKVKKWRSSIKGYVRCLEITHNVDVDTYHPHFHILLAVNPSYFKKSDTYITKQEFSEMWRDALGIDYDPVTYVRKVSDNRKAGAVAEVSKYSCKPGDYIFEDLEMMDETISVLADVLAGRRLMAYGGVIREKRKELKIADEEAKNADLVNVDGDKEEEILCPECQTALQKVIYAWNPGYHQYTKRP